MASITTTPNAIAGLNGSITIRGTCGEAMNLGDWLYLSGNKTWSLCDADAAATAHGRGMITRIGKDGQTAAVVGDPIEVTVFGPVDLGAAAAMTAGAVIFNSPTAGDIDATAPTTGDYPSVAGWSMSDRILFIDPQAAAPVVA